MRGLQLYLLFVAGLLWCATETHAAGTPPATWTCPVEYWNASDGCDCSCGSLDPDCEALDPNTPIFGCNNGTAKSCTENSTCVYWGVPSTWICDPSFYAAADGCDCECGAYDIDCETQPTPVYGCPGPNAVGCTNPNATCIYSSIPLGWTCEPSFYNTHDGCDCACGIRDPDCDENDAVIYGCLPGRICDADGSCKAIPGIWTCMTAYYNASDGCDCGCGIIDPDCEKPNQQLYGCPCETMTCVAPSLCVGECLGFLVTAVPINASTTSSEINGQGYFAPFHSLVAALVAILVHLEYCK